MQSHQLTTPARPNRKRVGRGGKRGTYAGRGNKGQKARSGGKVNPLFEGGRSSLVERMKKLRGFKSIHPKPTEVTLGALERAFKSGETVTLATLIERGLVLARNEKRGAKILRTGELKKKLTIAAGIQTTNGAREAIEKAGGTIEEKKA